MKNLWPNLCLFLMVAAAIILPACGGGGHTPPPPPVISVAITSPASAPTIQQGQSVSNITATVTNDSANKGVTWSLSGAGSLSAQTSTTVTYNAPASVSSNIVVTVTATSVSDNTKSASITITVTPAAANNNAALSGQYAFLISGFDDVTGDRFAHIGSFTANGSGTITAGIEDQNLPSGVNTAIAIQGSYTIGTDNRGTMTLGTPGAVSINFAFSLGAFNGSGVATKLDVIEFDDNNGASGRRGSGVAYLQDAAAFSTASITGPYAFEFVGQDTTTGTRLVDIGSFTATGSTTVTGSFDSNDNGSFTTGNAFIASLTAGAATATNGRVAFAETSGGSDTHVWYIVSATHVLSMETDAEGSSGLICGEILAQTSTSFTTTALTGNVVLYTTGLSSTAGNSYVQAGVLNFNSLNSSGTINLDTNDGGAQNTFSTNFTYAVAGTGETFLTPSTGTPLDLFLIDTNKAFVMDEGSLVNAGMLEAQSAGPFNNTFVNGSYFDGLAEYAPVTAEGVSSGVAFSSGNGVVFATSDQSNTGGQLLTAQAQTITLTINSSSGRATDASGNIYYIISLTRFVSIQPTAHTSSVLLFEQ
jgi:hypothetical protein